MQKITRDNIQDLLAIEDSPKVTIYIPLETTASPPHITENQIRFKNLVHAATDQLKTWADTGNISQMLTDAYDHHANNIEFWKRQSRGLLICAAPNHLEMFSLPVDTEEYVAVDDMFHLAPVLALHSDARDYYVLALARQKPKLYEGDMYGLTEMEIGLPGTMRSALGIDELNQESEHQGSTTGSSLHTGGFNGRGGAHDLQDVDRSRFFHIIDKHLLDKLDRTTPLILAGTDADTAEYKALSKYPHILEGKVYGNHTETRSEDLFEKTHAIVVDELVRPEHVAAKEEYERLSGANPTRVAGDTKSILEAAGQGRIDKLLAQMSRQTTDTVQDKLESVLRITFPEAEHSQTLNKLAAQVWQMSGKVLGLLPTEMPNGAPMVARLRY